MKKTMVGLLIACMVFTLALPTGAANSVRDATSKPVVSGSTTASPKAISGIEYTGYLADEDGVVIILDDDNEDQSVNFLAPGQTIYYRLRSHNDFVTMESAVSGVTFTQDWSIGSGLLSDIKIVQKKFKEGTYGTDYCYMLALTAKSGASIKSSEDLSGTLTLKKSAATDNTASGNAKGLGFTMDVRLFLNIGYEEVEDMDEIPITPKVFKPTNSGGDMTFKFEADENSSFSVNVSGQDKIAVGMSCTPITAIEDKYPGANLKFFTGNGATFNKTGELSLYGGSGYDNIYTVSSNNTLTPFNDAVYESSTGTFRIQTRSLGQYVIADRVLGSAETGTSSSSSSSTGSSSSGGTMEWTAGDNEFNSDLSDLVNSASGGTSSGVKVNPGTYAAA